LLFAPLPKAGSANWTSPSAELPRAQAPVLAIREKSRPVLQQALLLMANIEKTVITHAN
jgi:hypothetical protein